MTRRWAMYGWAVVWALVIGTSLVNAQVLPSSTYYTNTLNLTGTVLKASLHYDIKGHTIIAYTPTRGALAVIDRDSPTSTNHFWIYSNFLMGTNRWINDFPAPHWNREHLWPQSYGVDSNDGQSDLFNLRPCDEGVNSTRGNLYFDNASPSNTVANAPGSYMDGDSFEPRDDEKGQIARSMFYMAVRYEGISGEDNVANLELSDSPNSGAAVFGKLTTLLAWNRKYPVTDWERNRNSQICQNYQHNRNPFIDNPDFADMVFLGVNGFTAWQGTHFTVTELTDTNICGQAADPDYDGEPNLVEYALGHDPHIAEPGTIQSMSIQEVGGTNFLYLVHHKNHYASGITFSYETCSDLVSWTNETFEVLSSPQVDPQKELVTVRFPADTNAFFVRFKITQP
jgi:endonuclease I